jgi:hypothetical protein
MAGERVEINVWESFADDMSYVMESNVETISAHTNEEKLMTNSSHDIQNAWLGDPDATDAQGAGVSEAVWDAVGNQPGTGGHGWSGDSPNDIISNSSLMGNIADWTTSEFQKLLTKIGAFFSDDEQQGTLDMNTVQQEMTIIGSRSTLESSKSDSESKSEANVIQQDSSATQNQATAGTSVTDMLSSFSSGQAQLYA